jgi:hypothetical protein
MPSATSSFFHGWMRFHACARSCVAALYETVWAETLKLSWLQALPRAWQGVAGPARANGLADMTDEEIQAEVKAGWWERELAVRGDGPISGFPPCCAALARLVG